MLYLQFITLGFLQGLTEFLPISSSGHLWLLQHYWGVASDLSLEMGLHGASLLAVVVCMWTTIVKLVLSIKCQIFDTEASNIERQKDWSLLLKLVWSTLLTVPIALLMAKYVLINLSLGVVAWSLMGTGLLIWISTGIKGSQTSLTWKHATLIGLIQGLAVLPGISRSGITIVGLLLFGVNRTKAAEYSFLLSIPTILGAMVFLVRDLETVAFLSQPAFYLSAFMTFVVAVFAIRFMLRFMERWWGIWAVYCVGLGLILVASI